MFTDLRYRFRAIFQRKVLEAELEDELRLHLEHEVEKYLRQGMSREEALRRATMAMGGVQQVKEDCRDARGTRWLEDFWKDLRYAGRTFRKSPGFAAVAIASLSLGIGANTIVFSVLNALVLSRLPVAAPEKLFFVEANKHPTHSFPNYRDLRDRNTTFAGLMAYRITQMALEAQPGAQRVWGYLATGNYFNVLGVRPALGRFFDSDDDGKPGASAYAVLSYQCWKNRFAGDPNIAGKTIRINKLPFTVIGVAPPEFHGTELFYWPEIWVPMAMQPQIEGNSWLESRFSHNSMVIGRLKPTATVGEAEANLNAIASVLAKEHPAANEGLKIRLAQPGLVGDSLRGPVTAFAGGVMALAALVLFAACANLASLLAARATDRQRELAIRISVGAGRARIVRQLLTESLLLAGLGGAGGFILAGVLLRMLSQWRAPLDFPVQFAVDADWRVLLFAMAATLATGLIFGLMPARLAWRININAAWSGSGANGALGRRWAGRDVLLAVQVALCCLLVTTCFVSLNGLSQTISTPLGFRPAGVAVAGFDLGLARYSKDDGRRFQRRALDAVTQAPGVLSAAYANSLPLSIDQSSTTVFPENASDFRMSKGKVTANYEVSPGYFSTIGTRLLKGREFTWHDDAASPSVAVVNETFARQVLGTTDAVGKRFRYGGKQAPVEIVGLVEDGKYTALTESARPALFRSAGQVYNGTTVLLVRSAVPESEMAGAIRNALTTLDSNLAVYATGSAQQMLGLVFFPARAATIALSAFGVLAIMLAITGVYGVSSYAVSRRVREIGIRVAVGARPWHVLRSVLGRVTVLLAVGSGAGLFTGLFAARFLSGVIYQATSGDPILSALVLLTMGAVGLGSAWIPARRALGLDPMRALRES